MQVIVKRIMADKEREFTIVPIGDIHFRSLSFDEETWNKFLKIIKEEIKNPLFILVGDIIDDDRPSTRDRRKIMFYDRIDSYKIEDQIMLKILVNETIPRLSFLNKDNCLGIFDGDHYRLFSNGKTSTDVICKALGVPYLGNGQAIIRIIFQFPNTSRIFTIHARHGRGFCKTRGGKINANDDFISNWEGVDLFIKGHSHYAWFDNGVRNVVTKEGFIYQKNIYTINAGSFKKTFIMQEEIDKNNKEMEEKIKKIKNLEDKKNKKELLKALEEFIGIKKIDPDYPEIREYGPVNKNPVCFNIKIVKSRALKGYPDFELRKKIIEIEL